MNSWTFSTLDQIFIYLGDHPSEQYFAWAMAASFVGDENESAWHKSRSLESYCLRTLTQTL